MWGKIRSSTRILALTLVMLLWAVLALPSRGQEPLPQIFITGNDVTSPPSAVLHVYGRDGQGNAIDFTREPLILTQNGTQTSTTVTDTYPAGTFTVFLVDLPIGIEEQLPTIQQAILQFASANGGMQEQVDSIAIYQVGEAAPKQLLPPTTFYNEVQNFFVEDLTPASGSTALRDSLAQLLGQVEEQKPRPEMVTSVVVMSDGTDVVSTEYESEEIVALANEQNIPIHTVWVIGSGLTIPQQEEGQAYLQETARDTRGFATLLDDGAGISDLWSRIAAFRDHARVRFQIDDSGGGSYETVLSLSSEPTVTASTVVEIPENQPQVALNLPPESAAITLQSLDEPVLLRLGAAVSWLDGLDREVSEARLRVNGLDVADIPAEQLEDFTVEVSNLQYGQNLIELFVVDEQGLQATNLPAYITVTEGGQEIPAQLQPERETGNIILNIFLALVVLGVLVGLFFWLRRAGFMGRLIPKGRSQRSNQGVTYSSSDNPAAMAGGGSASEHGGLPFDAYLEIVESLTDIAPRQQLRGAMIRVGRSPAMCDIAFRDDLTVSRQHAVLMLEGYHYRLFDENSTSGSWVNGRQVPEYGVELADGDEIHLGAVHMIYRQL